MPLIHIFNTNLILPDRILKNASITLKDSKIANINKAAPKAATIINARGLYLCPGFIDTHIHGNPNDIIRNETRFGTTSFVVAVSCGRPIPDISGYPQAIGIRLEGPVINKVMAGAQDKRAIRESIRAKDLASRPLMITLAPELSGAGLLLRLCKERDIIPSIGHSGATYREAKQSFDNGIRHATHLFNAMSGPRHGSAGAGLAALFDKRVTVEIISDLKHVAADLLRLVFAVKSADKTILITDSVRAETIGPIPGVGCGHMIDCVKNAVRQCGVPLACAVRMASATPAHFFGLGRSKGSITPGMDADLIVFDKNFDVKSTVIGGRIMYQKRGRSKICAE